MSNETNVTSQQAFCAILALCTLASSEFCTQLLTCSYIEAVIPQECFELGNSEFGWRRDLMLRELWAKLEKWQRDALEGDEIVVPFVLAQELFGDVVSV